MEFLALEGPAEGVVLSSLFAGLSALAAIVTAAVASWSLYGSRRDSRERSRPVLVAHLVKAPSISHGSIYFVVENFGRSPAFNVEVDFDPQLPDYEKTSDGQPGVVAPYLRRRYESAISMIAPGQRLKNIYSYIALGSKGNQEPVPDKFRVNLRYTDGNGRKYADFFPLDTGIINLEIQSSPGDGNDPVKRHNKALEALVWELWN